MNGSGGFSRWGTGGPDQLTWGSAYDVPGVRWDPRHEMFEPWRWPNGGGSVPLYQRYAANPQFYTVGGAPSVGPTYNPQVVWLIRLLYALKAQYTARNTIVSPPGWEPQEPTGGEWVLGG